VETSIYTDLKVLYFKVAWLNCTAFASQAWQLLSKTTPRAKYFAQTQLDLTTLAASTKLKLRTKPATRLFCDSIYKLIDSS
jgi:hypothetical protein